MYCRLLIIRTYCDTIETIHRWGRNKSFGFEPRLYSRESYEKKYDYLNTKKGLTDIECNGNMRIFRKIFHYYVESAIPFACGIQEAGSDGHSIVCIGHGRSNYELNSK